MRSQLDGLSQKSESGARCETQSGWMSTLSAHPSMSAGFGGGGNIGAEGLSSGGEGGLVRVDGDSSF